MSQMRDCLDNYEECAKMRNAIPKGCLCETYTRCKVSPCEKLKCGYKYVQPSRPDPFKPKSNSYASNECFADKSVYNSSFFRPPCEPRQRPIIHKDHMVMAGEFQGKTVQKTSYPVQCVPVVQKIVPKDHCLAGRGPMKFTTTMQHDYYIPCGAEREESVKPKENLCVFSCPMEGKTITGCSYVPVCPVPVENYKPAECYTSPEDPMDFNTVQRTSYRVVKIPKKEETPWATKLEYCKPKTELNNCTIYSYSFKEPGGYVKEDCCGNMVPVNNMSDGCRITCLADQAEGKSNSRHIKAHQFEDE